MRTTAVSAFSRRRKPTLLRACSAKHSKCLPHNSYQLMNKVITDEGVDPKQRFDDMLPASQAEYFDIRWAFDKDGHNPGHSETK